MTKRAILLALLLGLSACTNDDSTSSDADNSVASQATEVDKAVDTLISVCQENGLSEESCTCSAKTSARILGEKDFLRHSELQLNRDQSGIDEFLRRKYAEDQDTMFRLGEALASCPGSLVPAGL
ncbi:MAG: hypothetical protein NXH88_08160 [Hyphomonas sp.]|nr:hypothetical protein [Hyphomonas sp.]